MITLETSLPLIMTWFSYLVITFFLGRLCSCYYPFLLSAKYYITIKNPRLRSILISPMLTRSTDSKTAAKDRDKLPLSGCIFFIVTIPWLFCEMIILFITQLLAVLGLDIVYSLFISEVMDIFTLLITSKYYWLFIFVMPIVHRLDYSIGMQRYFK